MDFTLTKEHKDIQKAAREFAIGEFKDVAREYDLQEIFPEKILDKELIGALSDLKPQSKGEELQKGD